MDINKNFLKLYQLLLEEKPKKADAIVWLQGDRYDRANKVLALHKDGYGEKIIITGNDVLIGNDKRPGEKNISLDKMKSFLLKKGVDQTNLIIDGGAMNTKEQAEHIFKILIDNGWNSFILVGSSYYQPRAFLTFIRQAGIMKWKGNIINQTVFVDWEKEPSGRNETAKVIFNQEFEKIKKYKNDLVSIEEGIKYLNRKNV